MRKAAALLAVLAIAALALFAQDLVAEDIVYNVILHSALSLGSLAHSTKGYFPRHHPLKIVPLALPIVVAFAAIFGQCYTQGEFDAALVPAQLALDNAAKKLAPTPELPPSGGCTRSGVACRLIRSFPPRFPPVR